MGAMLFVDILGMIKNTSKFKEKKVLVGLRLLFFHVGGPITSCRHAVSEKRVRSIFNSYDT